MRLWFDPAGQAEYVGVAAHYKALGATVGEIRGPAEFPAALFAFQAARRARSPTPRRRQGCTADHEVSLILILIPGRERTSLKQKRTASRAVLSSSLLDPLPAGQPDGVVVPPVVTTRGGAPLVAPGSSPASRMCCRSPG